ncbi:hypothetical protein GW17_00029239, partial [Ensete ventricosum]
RSSARGNISPSLSLSRSIFSLALFLRLPLAPSPTESLDRQPCFLANVLDESGGGDGEARGGEPSVRAPVERGVEQHGVVITRDLAGAPPLYIGVGALRRQEDAERRGQGRRRAPRAGDGVAKRHRGGGRGRGRDPGSSRGGVPARVFGAVGRQQWDRWRGFADDEG